MIVFILLLLSGPTSTACFFCEAQDVLWSTVAYLRFYANELLAAVVNLFSFGSRNNSESLA